MDRSAGILLLNRSEVTASLTMQECIEAVEQAFRLHAEGKALLGGLLHVDATEGEFHVKAGGLHLPEALFAFKVNGGFFRNRERFGLPNVQGIIYLCNGETGAPIALMDSIQVTIQRTGAATAVAAKYLSKPNSSVGCICGCGTQGKVQLEALTHVRPIREAYAYSRDPSRAQSFASEMSRSLGIRVVPVADPGTAAQRSDIVVTCTPSRQFFLRREDVSLGTFVAAVGADSPLKQELDPQLLVGNKVVVDILEQCAHVGELHHALDLGLMTREAVHAELGEVITGKKSGRTSPDEITIFDSTGTAVQDVAAATAIYRKAWQTGHGTRVSLND